MAARRKTARGSATAPAPAPRAPLAVLDAAAILGASDIRVEALDVPEWGGRVYIRTWSAADREAFETAVVDAGGKLSAGRFRATVCQLSVADAGGNLLFTPEQIPDLARRSAAAIQRVFQAADKLNTVTAAAQDDLQGN